MILILEDDADREAYRSSNPFNPDFYEPRKMLRNPTVWISPEAYRADAVLADLRAKVEALRGKWQRSVDRDPDGKLSGYDRAHVAALGDVLDLLDGGSDDSRP